MARPNRNRKKLTIYLSPDDRKNVEEIKCRNWLRTQAEAIRRAIVTTDRRESGNGPPPTDIERFLADFVVWAAADPLLTPKDATILRGLADRAKRLRDDT